MPPQFLVAQATGRLEQNPINGYPDGTFKPDAQVTYAEALKMILCALGYKPEVFRTVVWPVTWVAKAMDLGITSGVTLATGAANLPAVRADVARLVSNSLTKAKLVQTGYGDQVTYKEDPEKTLLGDMGYTLKSGRVVATALTDADLEENEVKIGTDTYTMPEGADTVALLGLEVKVWADSDNVVAHYEVTTAADKVLYDSVAELPAGKVKLLVKDKEYAWADGATKLVNFGSGTVAAGQYGRFVLDDKGKVAFAVLFDFTTVKAGLVTEATSSKVKYRLTSTSERELKYGNYDAVYVFSPKLATLKVGDIKADSVIYGWAGDNLYLVVAGEKKEGKLDAAKDTSLTLAGTSYAYGDVKTYSTNRDADVQEISGASALADVLGETVTVILDINGEVRHVRGDVTTTTALQFGVGLAREGATLDHGARIKVLGPDGTVKVYEFEDEADYTWLTKARTSGGGGWDGAGVNMVVAFKLNADGQIAAGQIATVYENPTTHAVTLTANSASGGLDLEADYDVLVDGTDAFATDPDEDTISFSGQTGYVVSSTAIFNEINPAAPATDSDVKTVSWSSIEKVTETQADIVAIKKAVGHDIALIYFVSGYANVVASTKYGVVTASPYLTVDGWKVKIDVAGEGVKEFLIVASTVDRSTLKAGYAVGFKLDAAGKIKEVISSSAETPVYKVSGSYVQFTDGNQPWYRVADNAVLYELNTDGTIKGSISVADLAAGDKVKYVLEQVTPAVKIFALVKLAPAAPAPAEVLVARYGLVWAKRQVDTDWYVTVLTQGQFKEYKVDAESRSAVSMGDFAKPTAVKFTVNGSGEMHLEPVVLESLPQTFNEAGDPRYVSFVYRAKQGLTGTKPVQVTADAQGNVQTISFGGDWTYTVASTSRAYKVVWDSSGIVGMSAVPLTTTNINGNTPVNVVAEDDTQGTIVAVLIW